MNPPTRTSVSLLLWLSASSMIAQVEWGVAGGIHASSFRLHCDPDAYACGGSATGNGGGSLAVQYMRGVRDSLGPIWFALELDYAQRRTEVEAHYSHHLAGGAAESAYAMDYGMLSIGYLPRFYFSDSKRWRFAPGLRFALPVWAQGSGWQEIQGALASPPGYYSYTAYDDLESFESVLGFDARLVALVEHLIPLDGENRLAIEAGVDHGFFPQQNALNEVSVNSTDYFLRLAYRFRTKQGRASVVRSDSSDR